MAKKLNDASDPGAATHRLAMSKHLPRFLAQIKLNDFGGTEYLLSQLASSGGWTGDLLFAKGELYRTAVTRGIWPRRPSSTAKRSLPGIPGPTRVAISGFRCCGTAKRPKVRLRSRSTC